MNKEQIIDEVYLDYSKNHFKIWEHGMDYESKESFIRKCKTDSEFSKTWGLKIEERELSLEERQSIYENEYTEGVEVPNNHWLNSKLTTRNIPTKLITITYNNETIESYEN